MLKTGQLHNGKLDNK